MRTPLVLVFLTASWALTACNPFHRDPVTEVTPDANVNTRWRATLVTPASLGGAVQINGEATMEPSRDPGNTEFKLNIANATAGGNHPWQIRHGRCDADLGRVAPTDGSQTIEVGEDGRGHASARVAMATPTTGNYYVTVLASTANSETVVACGNLAPPAR